MNETTTISEQPWLTDGYLGEVIIEGNGLQPRTYFAAIDKFKKLRLYDPSGQARAVGPHDRKQLTLVVEDAVPDEQARLIEVLKANRWQNVFPRP